MGAVLINRRIAVFKEYFERKWIVQIQPHLMLKSPM